MNNRSETSTDCLLNVFVRFAALPPLTVHFLLFWMLFSLFTPLWCTMNVWWVREAGGDAPPACRRRLTCGFDGNVRRRQMWWRLIAVYSSVCAEDEREARASEPSDTVILIRIFRGGVCQSQQRKRKNEAGMRGNDTLCVLGRHRGKLFLRRHYGSVNLGFPIKRDHTANMKYTLCIEHLIKYWLQTYMNLPHQIEPPVGGLALIHCIWYGNESRKQQGPLRSISYVVNLFILLSSPK